MQIVCLESPLEPSKAEIEQYEGRYTAEELTAQNVGYAWLALGHSIARRESATSPVLIYPLVWRALPSLREDALKSWVELYHRVDTVAFFCDLGLTPWMRSCADCAALVGCESVVRRILDVTDGRDPRDVLAGLLAARAA